MMQLNFYILCFTLIFTLKSIGQTSSNLFATRTDYSTLINSRGLFIYDIDLDGDGDIIVIDGGPVSTNTHHISVLNNNGDGTFGNGINYFTDPFYKPRDLFVSDVDNDGDGDIVVLFESNFLGVLYNNGNGTFANLVFIGSGGILAKTIDVNDLDGDGDGDIVLSETQIGFTAGAIVVKNNGNGTFTGSSLPHSQSIPNGRSAIIGDIDNDNDNDIIMIGNYSSGFGYISVYKNNGNGTFASNIDYASGIGNSTSFISDLDGDGDKDIVVKGLTGFSILKNNGNGTFATNVDYTLTTSFNNTALKDIFVCDFDGDGDNDIALSNRPDVNVLTNNFILIKLNNGAGIFTSTDTISAINSFSLYSYDLDNDGDNDLASISGATGILSIFLNQTCQGLPSTIIADGSTTICAGNSVTLSSTFQGASYQWKKNGNNIAGATFRSYTAKAGGTYVCVTNCGSTVYTSNSILVTWLENKSITLSSVGNSSFCSGDSVILNTTNVGINQSSGTVQIFLC